MATEPPPLFHYTCQHSYREIGHSGLCVLLPHFHTWLGKKLIWLTDLVEPDPRDVGLTSRLITCNRMEYRYVALDGEQARPWWDSPERASLTPADLHVFENDDDGRPADYLHWWITDRSLRARFDRTWHG